MNERLKQLAKQASIMVDTTLGQTTMPEYKAQVDLNKFAELIVRECAQAFEAEVDTWKQMDPYQGSIKRQGAKAIKEHFGVEE